MSKRSPTVVYLCGTCSKKCTDMMDAPLALLQLCAGCQETRRAAGVEAQRKADLAEARRV